MGRLTDAFDLLSRSSSADPENPDADPGAIALRAVVHARLTQLLLNPETAANPASVKRFEQEARAASALNHPGIVTIHDTGTWGGRFYIVMELVEGTTLRHVLRRGRPPLKKTLQIASQLADALAGAHEVGLVHRDLKPENVMVTTGGHVKIVDFGLAKLTEPSTAIGSQAGEGTVSERSLHGMLIGTIGYMSPVGTSHLVWTPNGVNYRLWATGLEPGHAYTLWIVAFNETAGCQEPSEMSFCGPSDVVNDAAQPDMMYAADRIASGTGTATFAGHLGVGANSGSLNAPVGLPAYGLLEPYGAEIHLAVHHHGPKLPAFMPDDPDRGRWLY